MIAVWLSFGVCTTFVLILTFVHTHKARVARNTHRPQNNALRRIVRSQTKNDAKCSSVTRQAKEKVASTEDIVLDQLIDQLHEGRDRQQQNYVRALSAARSGYVTSTRKPRLRPPAPNHSGVGYCQACRRRECWMRVHLIYEDDDDGRLQNFLQELRKDDELRRKPPSRLSRARTRSAGPK